MLGTNRQALRNSKIVTKLKSCTWMQFESCNLHFIRSYTIYAKACGQPQHNSECKSKKAKIWSLKYNLSKTLVKILFTSARSSIRIKKIFLQKLEDLNLIWKASLRI